MNYARDFDPYEYKDIYSNDEDAFNYMKHNLLTSKDTSNMIDWLSNDINIMATEKDLSDKNMSDLSKQAFNLINKFGTIVYKYNGTTYKMRGSLVQIKPKKSIKKNVYYIEVNKKMIDCEYAYLLLKIRNKEYKYIIKNL